MDHLHSLSPQRLVRALGAFLLSLLLTLAFAPVFAADETTVTFNESLGIYIARIPSPVHGCGGSALPSPWVFSRYINSSDVSCGWQSEYSLNPAGRCPEGQTHAMNGTTFSCKLPDCAPGQVRNTVTQQCQPPCHAAGTAGGSNYVSPFTIRPPSICRDGCSLTTGGSTTIPNSSGTPWYLVTGLVHTGEFCSGAQGANGDGQGTSYDEPGELEPITVTPDDDPPRCGPGQCPGDFNGVYVCMSCSDVATPDKPITQFDSKTETTTTGTPPDQTTETKTTETKSTHDGSGTVTSTTTTSTTRTDGNGTTTEEGKTEKKESQESFCKENPTSAFCKDGKWGGSCDAFTCEGDAVQCAIAREIHQRNCDAVKANPLTELADAAQAGTDNASTYIQTQKDAPALDVQARFAQNLDPSPIAGSCPASRSVGLPGGHSLEISFEKPCEIAGWLGNFVQAFAYLFAALIVLRNPAS
jgi:hypothetical protein